MFHDVTTDRNSGWSTHHWSILDNPRFPRWANKRNWQTLAGQFVEATRKRKNWTPDNPTYMREMLGRWVRDNSALVYPYAPHRNSYTEVQQGSDWVYAMGVDLGIDDATAIVVVGWNLHSPQLYEIETFAQSGMTVTAIARELKDLRSKYNPVAIVADTGGLGKMIAHEITERHGIPVEAAKKTDKRAHIEMLGDDLRAGKIKIKKGSPLEAEIRVLQWSDEKKLKEHDAYANHCCDAMLYAWRWASHYTHKDPEPQLPTEDRLERALIREIQEREDARAWL
jgi:hypothetical protein